MGNIFLSSLKIINYWITGVLSLILSLTATMAQSDQFSDTMKSHQAWAEQLQQQAVQDILQRDPTEIPGYSSQLPQWATEDDAGQDFETESLHAQEASELVPMLDALIKNQATVELPTEALDTRAAQAKTFPLNEIPCSDGACLNHTSEKNTSFFKVIGKLIQLLLAKEMKESSFQLPNTPSLKEITLFKGKTYTCHARWVWPQVNCCACPNDYDFVVKKACASDEKALCALRQKGRCHRVGIKEDDSIFNAFGFLSQHYCCFESKFMRVVQEQARPLLGKSWGTVEHPNCEGLTLEEIERLDWSQLNLEEVFEDLLERPSSRPDTASLQAAAKARLATLNAASKSKETSHGF